MEAKDKIEVSEKTKELGLPTTWEEVHEMAEFTNDKRESPRLQSWDESASMFFLTLDISDYGISRNASDRLAEIRTRP